jgi:hypothetical protein
MKDHTIKGMRNSISKAMDRVLTQKITLLLTNDLQKCI